jgi:uncharacterized membrane protein YccF (DUF307 family)
MAKKAPVQSGPTIVIVNETGGSGFLVRAVWFVFIGWWLSGLAILVAYIACATVIGLPLGFAIFNRLPAIITLRSRTKKTAVEVKDGVTYITGGKVAQYPMWARALWFVFAGLWLGAVYIGVAWFLCVTIIGLPIGLAMFNRTGAVMTLLKY